MVCRMFTLYCMAGCTLSGKLPGWSGRDGSRYQIWAPMQARCAMAECSKTARSFSYSSEYKAYCSIHTSIGTWMDATCDIDQRLVYFLNRGSSGGLQSTINRSSSPYLERIWMYLVRVCQMCVHVFIFVPPNLRVHVNDPPQSATQHIYIYTYIFTCIYIYNMFTHIATLWLWFCAEEREMQQTPDMHALAYQQQHGAELFSLHSRSIISFTNRFDMIRIVSLYKIVGVWWVWLVQFGYHLWVPCVPLSFRRFEVADVSADADAECRVSNAALWHDHPIFW